MADNNCTCSTNLATVKVSKLPLADSSSFYSLDDDNNKIINANFEEYSNLILSHYYTNPEDSTYYFKSEKTTVKDLADYVIFKYDSIHIPRSYLGSFSGYFTHSPDSEYLDDLYGKFHGTSSGEFTGSGKLDNSEISNSIITDSSITDTTVLTSSLSHGMRGTFTGSVYNATDDVWIDKYGEYDDVTYYGKSLYSETSSYSKLSEKAKVADRANFVELSECDSAKTATHANTADSATTAISANTSEFAKTSSVSFESDTAKYADKSGASVYSDSSSYAVTAEYAKNIATDDYPVGYAEYVKVTPGNGTDECKSIDYDGTNYKWIKFKCKSTGIYSITYDYTALRLTKFGSNGQVIPIPRKDIYYAAAGSNNLNQSGQAMYLTIFKINPDTNMKEGNDISGKNTYNVVIQFPYGGQSADQYCPETIQCRNIIYDIKLQKDTTYLVVLNYDPVRSDCIVNNESDPCNGDYFCGLYYKISPLDLNREGLNYNTYEDRNKDHGIKNGYSIYVNPVLEIRKIKYWDAE